MGLFAFVEDENMDMSTLKKIKSGSVSKVGGFSTGEISYVLFKSDDDIYVQLTGNSTSGHFSREVVALSKVKEAIGDKNLITSRVLAQAFASKSRNNAPFLMAVLVGESLVSRVVEPMFHYAVTQEWAEALHGYFILASEPETDAVQKVDIHIKSINSKSNHKGEDHDADQQS